MNVLLFGASGNIGRRIAAEALSAGHQVTAVSRKGQIEGLSGAGLSVVAGDVSDPAQVAKLAAGHDAVISAIGPAHGEDPAFLVAAARSLLDGVRAAGVSRLLIVGGAGGLEVSPGVQLVDTPDFPEAWRPVAKAHRAAYEVYRDVADLDWTYVAPAALIEPGERTGEYRVGGDQLLTDENGNSRISTEDYATALVAELANGQAIRRRITVAY